jgi:hypothetical protein
VTPVFGEEACRDIHAAACAPAKPRGQVVLEGEYWGLLIGINNYQFQPKLKTAVQDATAVREVLSQRYGFKSDHLQMLTDENATRDNILHALDVLQQQAGDKDSVFIYYAGHGETNTDKTRGWWIPVEGKSKGSFISNEDLRAELADIKARHVYVVADSCFSGTFLRAGIGSQLDRALSQLYKNPSRWALTSGMNEPVADGKSGGHSPFAYQFIKLLKEYEGEYLIPTMILNHIRPLVAINTEQTPRSEPIHGAGQHDGGEFLFHNVSYRPAEERVVDNPPAGLRRDLQAEIQRLNQEHDQFIADITNRERELENEYKLLLNEKENMQQGWTTRAESYDREYRMLMDDKDSTQRRWDQMSRLLDEQKRKSLSTLSVPGTKRSGGSSVPTSAGF